MTGDGGIGKRVGERGEPVIKWGERVESRWPLRGDAPAMARRTNDHVVMTNYTSTLQSERRLQQFARSLDQLSAGEGAAPPTSDGSRSSRMRKAPWGCASPALGFT